MGAAGDSGDVGDAGDAEDAGDAGRRGAATEIPVHKSINTECGRRERRRKTPEDEGSQPKLPDLSPYTLEL